MPVTIESRPNTVMNHGMPAAGSRPTATRPLSFARMRSAARSEIDCETARSRSSQSARSCGTRSCQAVSESRTCWSSSPKRRSAVFGCTTSPDGEGTTSTTSSQRSRGCSSIAYVAHAPSTRLGGCERITCVAALLAGSASRNWPSSASKRGSASGGSGGACNGSPNEKSYDFTVKMSAKSEPISSASLERDRLDALVLDRDVVLHGVADEARAGDRERVLRQRLHRTVAQEEGGRVVLDLVRGQQQRQTSLDGEPEDGEVPRVVREEAARLVPEVAALIADAEGRALEDRERHGGRLPIGSVT